MKLLPFNGMWFVSLKGLNLSERINRRKWKKRLILMKQYANKVGRL